MDLDPLITEGPTVRPMPHRGIVIVMTVVIGIGACFGVLFAGLRFGIGILTGGILAFANYFWLERSTRAIFENAALASTGLLAAKYILRYVAIGAVLFVIWWSDVLPIAAVITGLGAFAIAVVLQGLKNIFTSSF